MGPGVSLAACSCPQLAVGDAEVVASEQHRGGCEQGTLLGVEALMLGNLQALSLALAPAPLVPFATLFCSNALLCRSRLVADGLSRTEVPSSHSSHITPWASCVSSSAVPVLPSWAKSTTPCSTALSAHSGCHHWGNLCSPAFAGSDSFLIEMSFSGHVGMTPS